MTAGGHAGRPRVGEAVIVRFPDLLLSALTQRARELGISRAELVRRLVAQGLGL